MSFLNGVNAKRRKKEWKNSDAGTRTRVAWVKARYPNQLDYVGITVTCILSIPITKVDFF